MAAAAAMLSIKHGGLIKYFWIVLVLAEQMTVAGHLPCDYMNMTV